MGKLCEKGAKHQSRPIEALCLELSCFADPLLCFFCVFESHQSHSIMYLHKELNPQFTQAPSKNHFHEAHHTLRDFLNTISAIPQGLVIISDELQSNVDHLSQLIRPQLETLQEIAQGSHIDNFINELDSINFSRDRIAHFSRKMSIARKSKFLEVAKLSATSQHLQKGVNLILATAAEGLQRLFSEAQNQLLKIPWLVPEDYSEEGQPRKMLKKENTVLDEAVGNSQTVENTHKSEEPSTQEKQIKMQESVRVQKSKSSKCEYIVINDDEQMDIQPRVCQSTFNLEDGVAQRPTKKNVKAVRRRQEAPESKQGVTAFCVEGHNHRQIEKKLFTIPVEAQRLTITCDTMPCALNSECIDLLCTLKNLKSLRVNWGIGLEKKCVLRILRSMPLLEELTLSEFNQLDGTIVTSLCEYTPKLKKLIFRSDASHNLQLNEENFDFFPDFGAPRVNEQFQLDLFSHLSYLESLVLINISLPKKWIPVVRDMKVIKEVYISQSEGNQVNPTDLDLLLVEIGKNAFLTSITLECVTFSEPTLLHIIETHPMLHTLVIQECQSFTNATIACLAEHSIALRQLSLSLMDKFDGRHIQKLKGLKTLVLRGCWGIDGARFERIARELKELTCLSICFNTVWVNDSTIKCLSELKNLRMLNISSNRVTNEGLKFLSSCAQLRALHCGQTEITATGFKSIQNVPLRKLSFPRLNIISKKDKKLQIIDQEQTGVHLIYIQQAFPALTHINICGFKDVKSEHFAYFEKLQLIIMRSADGFVARSTLKTRGANLHVTD